MIIDKKQKYKSTKLELKKETKNYNSWSNQRN